MSLSATQLPLPLPLPHTTYPISAIDRKPTPSTTGANGSTMSTHSLQPAGTPQTMPEPREYRGERENYRYSLIIEQQPVRARMCGFGDKDRRPITPPPCVRIIITDVRTGQEVPAEEIDSSFFVLSVDLWDEHGTHEKNVVRASSNSPAVSISTATTTSYPPQMDRPAYPPGASGMPMYGGGPGYAMPGHPQQYQYGGAPGQLPPVYAPGAPASMYHPQSGYQQPYQGAHPASSPAYPQSYGQPSYGMPQSSSSNGMFTRNLIGNLTVNAFQLEDPKKRQGHWFVLQDLSVRTEGTFRLKMSFIDMGTHKEPFTKEDKYNRLSQGKDIPVLASSFSAPFTVFSAKKFPGVIESTELSKAFAQQGIKIPIRKDGGKGDGDNDDSQLG